MTDPDAPTFASEVGDRRIVWAPQPGPQEILLRCGVQDLFFGGARGGAKAIPNSFRINNLRGSVPIADLTVGDQIVHPSGATQSVLGVYPQGVKPVYTLTLESGLSAECTMDHLWNVILDDTGEFVLTTAMLNGLLADGHDVRIPVIVNDYGPTEKQRVVSVEYIRDDECTCIKVSEPDGLFVLWNGIVTHNTDGLIGDAGYHVVQNPVHANAILFRKTYKQLDEIVRRTQQIYPTMGLKYNAADYVWKHPRGAQIRLRYLENDADAEEYQGFNLTYVGVDEVGNFGSPVGIDRLWGALRSAHGVKPLRRLTGNPGGPGTVWIRERYIKGREPFVPFTYRPNPQIPFEVDAVFIPSRLEDNRILIEQDPGYEARLAAIGDPELYKAWRYGDWYVLKGAFFGSYSDSTHVYHDAELDPWLPRWIAIDWGFSHNSAVMWAAWDGDSIYVEREYLTSGLTPIQLAERIVQLNNSQPLERIFLSHDAFGRRTSERTIAMDMGDVFRANGLPAPTSSDRDRKGSLQVLQHRFTTNTLKIHASCHKLREAVKLAQRDEKNPEDVAKWEGDDALDALMYLCKVAPGDIRIPDEVRIRRLITSKDPQGRHMQWLHAKGTTTSGGSGVSFRRSGPRWAR